MWPTARVFYFVATVALESKAALGLAIPYKATAENTTIYKGSGVVSDPSSWDRKLYGGRGNSWPLVSRIDAAAAVALDFKAALGLAIPNNPMATYTTIDTGPGVVIGLSSSDRRLCRGWSNSWLLVGRIDDATGMALDSKAALR